MDKYEGIYRVEATITDNSRDFFRSRDNARSGGLVRNENNDKRGGVDGRQAVERESTLQRARVGEDEPLYSAREYEPRYTTRKNQSQAATEVQARELNSDRYIFGAAKGYPQEDACYGDKIYSNENAKSKSYRDDDYQIEAIEGDDNCEKAKFKKSLENSNEYEYDVSLEEQDCEKEMTVYASQRRRKNARFGGTIARLLASAVIFLAIFGMSKSEIPVFKKASESIKNAITQDYDQSTDKELGEVKFVTLLFEELEKEKEE